MDINHSANDQHSHEQNRDIAELADALAGATTFADGLRRPVVEKIRAARAETNTFHLRAVDRLKRLGVPDHVVLAGLQQAKVSGATLVHELVSNSQLEQAAYYSLMASDLGLPFQDEIDPKRMVKDLSGAHVKPGRTIQVCYRSDTAALVFCVAPDLRVESQLIALFAKNPAMRIRFTISDPQKISRAIDLKSDGREVANAVNLLHERAPHLSAKETLVPKQAFVLGVFLTLFPLALWGAFWPTVFAVHALSIILFGVSVAIRIAAWRALKPDFPDVKIANHQGDLPVYSVLVALHKEAAVVPQLVRAMAHLDWPMSRMEVLYICEADDAETISALNSIRLPKSHRVIRVPVAQPRTKPKALNFALAKSTGEFVVVYDAEDRPHPRQLKEAWSRFRQEPETLACLQAPLNIANASQSWLAHLFAFEYAAHFHGLLPYLSKIGAPLPLGGTSNHFRRTALGDVMGWDPFNVTEDADLGIRLCRFGYRSGVLSLPTLEDAPKQIEQWIPQRTRWIKGWMQTFLVHNRDFDAIKNSIGRSNNTIFQILMISFILSPLLYGVSILEIMYFIYTFENGKFAKSLVVCLDLALFTIGHAAYAMLGVACWRRLKGKSTVRAVLTLPAYWLLASAAAWRAIWKLVLAPHQWEKTTHEPAFKPGPSN